MRAERTRARAPAAGALIVAMLLVASCTTSTSPSPSASASAEPTATPTESGAVAQKQPAADVDELLTRLYAALTEHDDAAFAASIMYGAIHGVYYTDGTRGEETATIPMDGYHVADGGFTSVEMTAEPLVAGDLVAVPVAYTYPGEVNYGIDLMRIVHFRGGLLIGNGATFFGSPTEVDPDAEATIGAEAAAWTAGDAEAAFALFTDDGAWWEGIVEGSRTIHTGEELASWLAATMPINVTVTGEPITSGAFVAAVNRLQGDTADDFFDGISLYEMRNGKIALHVWLG